MKDIKEITKKLEDGVKELMESGRFAEYLDFMSRFHNYSFGNTILIYLQCPNATYVAGYKTWQKMNRYVMKGQKGISILAPRHRKIEKAKENEFGETETETIEFTQFIPTTVFDISQTGGEELPQIAKKLEDSVVGFETLVEKIKGVSPVPVEFGDVSDGASGYFSRTENKIVVKSGMGEAQTLKTLIHEVSHSILHGENSEEKEADRQTKEVQAESVAYTVCSALGLDTSDYSFGYIASWSSGKDLKELNKSMEVVRKTASEIIEKIA